MRTAQYNNAMTNSPLTLTFKPAEESQRELIHQWLTQDYIREWIHGQGLQNTLNGLEKFFKYTNEGNSINRKMTLTQHWVGYDKNKPIVYLLTSNIIKNSDDEYAPFCEEEGHAITLDIFIVDKDYLGKGYARTIIQEFILNQFADVTEVFIDPEKSNTRAAHVYQKAGFKIIGEFIASWHPVPHHRMRLKMKALQQLIKST